MVGRCIMSYQNDCHLRELQNAVLSALYGEELDDYGTRDKNGLYRYPDLDFVKKVLEDALRKQNLLRKIKY
jgi:hypothetical protein